MSRLLVSSLIIALSLQASAKFSCISTVSPVHRLLLWATDRVLGAGATGYYQSVPKEVLNNPHYTAMQGVFALFPDWFLASRAYPHAPQLSWVAKGRNSRNVGLRTYLLASGQMDVEIATPPTVTLAIELLHHTFMTLIDIQRNVPVRRVPWEDMNYSAQTGEMRMESLPPSEFTSRFLTRLMERLATTEDATSRLSDREYDFLLQTFNETLGEHNVRLLLYTGIDFNLVLGWPRFQKKFAKNPDTARFDAHNWLAANLGVHPRQFVLDTSPEIDARLANTKPKYISEADWALTHPRKPL